MTFKFKVGDKVKLLKSFSDAEKSAGEIGPITSIGSWARGDGSVSISYVVTLRPGYTLGCLEDHLELVTDEA